MKLSNQKLVDLASALNEFDAKSRPVLNDKRELVGHENDLQYKIKWKATYAIARSKSALKAHIDAIEQARLAIVRGYADGKEFLTSEHPKFSECMKDITALLKTEVEVTDLHQTKLDDLNPETNHYSPSTITNLLPLILE